MVEAPPSTSTRARGIIGAISIRPARLSETKGLPTTQERISAKVDAGGEWSLTWRRKADF